MFITIACCAPALLTTITRTQVSILAVFGLLTLYGTYWFLTYDAFGVSDPVSFFIARAETGIILDNRDTLNEPFALTSTAALTIWALQPLLSAIIIYSAIRSLIQQPLMRMAATTDEQQSQDPNTLDSFNV